MDGKGDADGRRSIRRHAPKDSLRDGLEDGLGSVRPGAQRQGSQSAMNEFKVESFDISQGEDTAAAYGDYLSDFRDVCSVFDALQRLSGRGVAEDAIDHSLNWLILSAWSNLDKMKEIQDDIGNRLQEIKKTTGILH